MGKNLKNASLVQRTGKVAFYKPAESTDEFPYKRMEGFTELSNAKNPKEYNRQYVDEDFERTDIIGYSASISYAFDRYKGNAVLDDIIDITENEKIGENSVREIIVVDMTTATNNGTIEHADAYLRYYAVIPDTDGDSTDCLAYSGTFKTRGEMTKVTVYSSDDWQTLSLDAIEAPKLSTLSITGVELSPTFSETTYAYTATTANTSVTINSTANSDTYSIIKLKANETIMASSVPLTSGENVITIIVTNGSLSQAYTLTITKTEG